MAGLAKGPGLGGGREPYRLSERALVRLAPYLKQELAKEGSVVDAVREAQRRHNEDEPRTHHHIVLTA